LVEAVIVHFAKGGDEADAENLWPRTVCGRQVARGQEESQDGKGAQKFKEAL
jgi:hypothetical protein